MTACTGPIPFDHLSLAEIAELRRCQRAIEHGAGGLTLWRRWAELVCRQYVPPGEGPVPDPERKGAA